RLPERARFLDVVGEVQRRADRVDSARRAPDREDEAQREQTGALDGEELFELPPYDPHRLLRHERVEAREEVLRRGLQRQISGEGHEEEQEREQREHEVIRELRRAVADRVVRPAPVQHLGEPEKPQLGQAGDPHGRKLGTPRYAPQRAGGPAAARYRHDAGKRYRTPRMTPYAAWPRMAKSGVLGP